MNILVTGGSGYIGSHTIVELINAGHQVVAVDNLSNSSAESLHRVAKITGVKVPFYQLDCRDKSALSAVFKEHKFDAVIHFAGLKSVSESVAKPVEYYQNNVGASLVLCDVMREHNVKTLIFSSTASVYGSAKELPLTEQSHAGDGITNPYARSKFMIEQILRDLAASDPDWHITILRYFNPIGAHASGLIGEDPQGQPNNLVPFITQVAVGRRPELSVFGNDYDTPDGTGVRDYIHVVDLARGHVATLSAHPATGTTSIYNLGTGQGTSVLQAIRMIQKASGKKIPYSIKARRPGDVASSYADPTKANRELGWHATYTVEQACTDAYNWQAKNPNGYNLL